MDADIPFTPNPDVATLLNRLLDIYERRGGSMKQTIRVSLHEIADILPGYYNQTNPTPRVTANEQLLTLEKQGWVALTWEHGQRAHLLDTIALATATVAPLYMLLQREPLATQRKQLRNLLLGNRFRVHDWRKLALNHILAQVEAQKSPAPFTLNDPEWNQDLLDALLALPDTTLSDSARSDCVTEELPYRVFSVRVFNDSKRFEILKNAVARLARRHHQEWRESTNQEALRELGLVPNPGHLYLYGPWQLVDVDGQMMSLGEFYPSVGIPATLAGRLTRAWVNAPRVICVENLTSFYDLVRHEKYGIATLCLLGNPSPACRHLLHTLVDTLPPEVELSLWADMDYGGLNILAQVRKTISTRFKPYRMDITTLETYAHWGQPLTASDQRNLTRLRDHPTLEDMVMLIDTMLLRGIKLEQEAIVL
ncbi:MAG: DUF2399 domain-containing protein [Anaerolineae bacterium]|nr:DUF2399 domain-containing protein [Anaerolineae bacterium]